LINVTDGTSSGWTSAPGTSLTFTGLLENSYILDVQATDAAGNTSALASLSFDLSRYSLSGTAVLTSNGVPDIGTATGEIAGVSNQNWGGYSMTLSGTWWETGSSTYTLIAGGLSTDNTAPLNDSGYWIETISNAVDGGGTFSGTSNFLYLSYDRLGTGTGTLTGSYSGGPWSATDTGTYTETPLAWSGNIGYDQNDSGLYTVDSLGINQIGDSYNGLLGGITPSLSNPTVTFMGPYNWATGLGPFIWTPVVYSANGSFTYAPSYDGNEFWGYIGGTWKDGTIDAKVYNLYIDSSGNAGILKGSLTGAYYPSLSMLQADGTWMPIQITTGIPQSALPDLTYSPSWSWWSNSFGTSFFSNGWFTLGGVPLDSAISVVEAEGRKDSITGEPWGIWQTILGGDYSAPGDGWILFTEVIDSSGNIAGTYTDGTQWSNGAISGTTYAYGADITATPQTWIGVGETIGTFDPTAFTWQAVQTGAWLETTKFLGMIATGKTTELAALNIPFVEVGRTNLTGTNDIDMNATMNNVIFFAYNSGEAPKIWATNEVTGNYTCSVCSLAPITLSGAEGLSATMAIQQWDTTNNKWTATVNGGGTYTGTDTMNGTTVQMNGAAAGGIDTTGPGTFSGTGAGTAQ